MICNGGRTQKDSTHRTVSSSQVLPLPRARGIGKLAGVELWSTRQKSTLSLIFGGIASKLTPQFVFDPQEMKKCQYLKGLQKVHW